MKKINAFFIIGSVGMIVNALLHMLLAAILPQASLHLTFFVLYPVFLSFMALGFGQMLKMEKVRVKK